MTSGTVDGLHYELHGGPIAGREVVLLSSGLGGSGAFWAPQMQALTARWPVVTYDHRGTGRSVRELPPHYTLAHMAEDMVKVMDALKITPAYTHMWLMDSAIKDAFGYGDKGFWGLTVTYSF